VAKRFDPMAKLATAWSLEGWIQCEANKRPAAANPALQFCPQSDTLLYCYINMEYNSIKIIKFMKV